MSSASLMLRWTFAWALEVVADEYD